VLLASGVLANKLICIYLSREEFELLKRLNPKLMEMRACHIVYLTELPQGKTPPPAVPKPAPGLSRKLPTPRD
jgi:hypothetical protein